MAVPERTKKLIEELEREGISVPEDCYQITFEDREEGAASITFRCYLTRPRVIKVGRAISSLGEDAKKSWLSSKLINTWRTFTG